LKAIQPKASLSEKEAFKAGNYTKNTILKANTTTNSSLIGTASFYLL
jgi:hypothetical protein